MAIVVVVIIAGGVVAGGVVGGVAVGGVCGDAGGVVVALMFTPLFCCFCCGCWQWCWCPYSFCC